MSEQRTFRLDKLVRDRIVEEHIADGARVEYTVLEGEAKKKALGDKTIEEVGELTTSTRPLSELADLLTIFRHLVAEYGFTIEQVEAAEAEKTAKNGGFAQGHFVTTETWSADHRWAQYYAADPARFPEANLG